MPDIWGLLSTITTFWLYATALLVCGRVFFDMVVMRSGRCTPNTHHRRRLLAILGLVLSALSFALRGAALTGTASGMTDLDMLALLWSTPVGSATLARLLGFGALLSASLVSDRSWPCLFGVLLIVVSFTRIGHTLDIGGALPTLMLCLHVAGMAFWVGALAPLYRSAGPNGSLDHAARLSHRFGQVAFVAIPLSLIAGGGLAWWLLGDVSRLITTPYGHLLLGKIALACGLLGLAGVNKLRFVPEMRAGNARATHHLRFAIIWEAAAITAVLGLTAILTNLVALPEPL